MLQVLVAFRDVSGDCGGNTINGAINHPSTLLT